MDDQLDLERLRPPGDHPALPFGIISGLAWAVVSHLMERHDNLVVLELHPADGQYDCLSVFERPNKLVCHLNLGGSLTHAKWFDHGGDRITWPDVLTYGPAWAAEVIEDIEDLFGRMGPRSPETVTAAACAAITGALAFKTGLSMRSAVSDDSYSGAHLRSSLIDRFRGPIRPGQLRLPNFQKDPAGSGAYRWWFLAREAPERLESLVCLDAKTASMWIVPDRPPVDLTAVTPGYAAGLVLAVL